MKYQLWNLLFFLLYRAFMNDDIHNRSEIESVFARKEPPLVLTVDSPHTRSQRPLA